MGTINDKLTYLNGTKTAIKDAIVAKGGTVSENDTFRSYANKISNLPSGQPNLQDKTVSPTTSQQTVTADAGYDGLDEITVNGVTSAIDNNIQAGNIKKNTTILGVTGTYEGIDTSDANATSDDIRAGKTAYVKGTKKTGSVPEHKYSGMPMGGRYTDAEQFTPGTFLSSGRYIAVASAVTSGYVGSNFIVEDNKLRVGVPNSMLQSAGLITADKIKVGESIYGVRGTFTNDATATANDILENKTAYVNGNKLTGTLGTETKNVTPSTSAQTITPSSGKLINEIIVSPIVLENVSVTPSTSSQTITPSSGKDGIGQVSVSAIETETKTVKSTWSRQTITPTTGKLIDEMIVEPMTLENKDVTISTNGRTSITAGTGYDGLLEVDVVVEGIVDWTQIGYSAMPDQFSRDFAYSQYIYQNWDSSITNCANMYLGDKQMRYMPLVDTSNVIDMSGMFRAINMPLSSDKGGLLSIPLLDTSNVTNMNYMFSGQILLRAVPQFDTRNVTNMANMFNGASSLEDVPIFDVCRVTSLTSMFSSCSSLSNNSLNNILAMCVGATSYTSTKTLKQLGLTSAQATTCQNLSNWSEFVSAGWLSGY